MQPALALTALAPDTRGGNHPWVESIEGPCAPDWHVQWVRTNLMIIPPLFPLLSHSYLSPRALMSAVLQDPWELSSYI